MDLGSPKWELSHPANPSTAKPRMMLTLHFPTGKAYFTPPAGGRKVFSRPSNSPSSEKRLQLSQRETTTLNSGFPPNDFHSQRPLPASTVLYKVTFLSFDLWACLSFCHSLHVPNCIPKLLFLNKPIFLVK